MKESPREASAKITATLEFVSKAGHLKVKSILLATETDIDETALKGVLSSIVRPDVYSRLLRKDVLGLNPLLLIALLLEEFDA